MIGLFCFVCRFFHLDGLAVKVVYRTEKCKTRQTAFDLRLQRHMLKIYSKYDENHLLNLRSSHGTTFTICNKY